MSPLTLQLGALDVRGSGRNGLVSGGHLHLHARSVNTLQLVAVRHATETASAWLSLDSKAVELGNGAGQPRSLV